MKRSIIIAGLLAALLTTGLLPGGAASADDDRTASAPGTGTGGTGQPFPPGSEGCPASYWSTHRRNWPHAPGDGDPTYGRYYPKRSLATVFTGLGRYRSLTMLEGLELAGGTTPDGARQELIRAATAAVLNADHEGVAYPLRRWDPPLPIIDWTNRALERGDDRAMLRLARRLQAANQLGCPLDDTIWMP